MAQIIYLSVKNLEVPIGGVIVQAEHVATLCRAGFDAKVSSTFEGGRPDWINPDASFANGKLLPIRSGDTLVLHDSLPRHIFDRFISLSVRRVFFCQNHYYLDSTLQPHERLSDFPIDAFLCVSEPIAEYLRKVHGVENPVIVRPAIRPAPMVDGPKKLQVCYMPRKRVVEFGTVMYGMYFQYPELRQTAFSSIHKMHPDKVAERMAESAIFLSLSTHEGLGLPPLEAMAAGCVVVGYHGGGGLDYATEQNGRWYDEATPDNLVHLLGDTLTRLRADPDCFASMIEAGRRTAAGYSQSNMEKQLLDFWSAFC
ncbi:glycosyltransferase [Nisaea sediminum]|uniref:glycosyltransferase n=1 Tax=Nisaea sediminum TaxID=2775867 RepID=UPI0018671AA0|nr:glycosyltransferase [Nisaea sediminum]